jgi:hypothetical protein
LDVSSSSPPANSADATPAPESTPTQRLLPHPRLPPTPAIPTAPDGHPPAHEPILHTISPTTFTFPSPYWEFFQTGGLGEPTFVFENSALRIDISSTRHLVDWHSQRTHLSDVFIRAKVSASPSGSVGLICRYSEAFGWFEFNVASDGTYNALYGQWLPGSCKIYSHHRRPKRTVQHGRLEL